MWRYQKLKFYEAKGQKVLYLLGAGSAYPETELDNSFLEQVGTGLRSSWIEEKVGIKTRVSALPLDYIRETGNLEVFEANKAMQVANTELGLRAARQALERAGISAEQVGLVLGESSTPIETTPSEAQRIAGHLGLRCQAYDVFSSGASFALHLDTLFNWRDEVLPEYILCVYSNTPSTRINYREGMARTFFGDAGAAVVLSTRTRGKLQVTDAYYAVNPGYGEILSVEALSHLEMRPDLIEEFFEPKTGEMLQRALEHNQLNRGSVKFVGTDISPLMLKALAESQNISALNVLSNAASRGYSMGSSPAAVLADNWSKFGQGTEIVVALAGAGFSFGYTCLKA